MDEKNETKNVKSPVGAAFLSVIPGLGFFYAGNKLKGLASIIVMGFLLVLLVQGSGNDVLIFSLLMAGFYIYQIFDSFEEARKSRDSRSFESEKEKNISLLWACVIVAIGIIFQLSNLGIIKLRDVARLWPVVLIFLGAKYIYNYYMIKREGGENG